MPERAQAAAPPARVQVWMTSLENIDDQIRRAHQNFLSPDERARWQRFVVQDAADQYAAGRALIRSQLSRQAGVPPERWVFGLNSYGRPHVIEPIAFRGLHFNLSHTPGLAACAISSTYDVGIDVEAIARDLDFTGMAQFFFAKAEVDEVRRARAGDVRELFYSYWTLKESYIKGRGMGLSIPLDSFWFELQSPQPRLRTAYPGDPHPDRWQFRRLQPTQRHAAALAVAAASDIPLSITSEWVFPGQPAPAIVASGIE